MLKANFFNTFFVFPILNLLVLFYKGFLILKIRGAFGFAIIALTILVRLLLHPFFKQQIEMSKKMNELKPHLDKLSQKHKNDQKTLQQEQLKLYQQAGINPASGCLFMIIQMPIFIALYNTLSLFLINSSNVKIISDINKVLYFSFLKIQTIDPFFFGVNLALTPAKSGQWLYLLVPVVTGVLQYLQVSVTTPPQQSVAVEKKPIPVPTKEGVKADEGGDFQKAMNTQMKYMFPLLIGYAAYNFPIGLALYWNIFSLFSILQYRKVNKSK